MKYALLILSIILTGCAKPAAIQSDDYDTDIARAVLLAKGFYEQAVENNISLKNGPCLSNTLMDDWVVDIVHNPRDPVVDDDPKNQCEAYLNGDAHHFVELDMDGNLIRAI